MWKTIRVAAVTVLGSGFSPIAPGTAGTAAAIAILAAIYYVIGNGSVPNRWAWEACVLGVALVGCIITVRWGGWIVIHYKKSDPGQCVSDELAGTAVTAMGLPLLPFEQMWVAAVAVFLWFRVMDIVKPPPARQLEILPLGWGILLDDVMAGIYANIACQLSLRLLLPMVT